MSFVIRFVIRKCFISGCGFIYIRIAPSRPNKKENGGNGHGHGDGDLHGVGDGQLLKIYMLQKSYFFQDYHSCQDSHFCKAARFKEPAILYILSFRRGSHFLQRIPFLLKTITFCKACILLAKSFAKKIPMQGTVAFFVETTIFSQPRKLTAANIANAIFGIRRDAKPNTLLKIKLGWWFGLLA